MSVELTTETEKEMLEEAAGYHAWDPARITIKVPFSEIGLRVLHQLVEEGGENERDLSDGDEPGLPRRPLRRDVREHLLRPRAGHGLRRAPGHLEHAQHPRPRGTQSKIIVGSIRHMMDVNEALEAGAHVPTITPAIIRKMVWHPRTIETINEFNTAWRNRGKK